MATQTFSLSEATASDVPGMIEVYLKAFSSDYFGNVVFPRGACSDAELRTWLQTRFTSFFTKRESRTFKITEGQTGKIVAFLRWTFPHELTEEEKKEREAEKEQMGDVGDSRRWPPGANLELCVEKFGGLNSLQEKYVDKKEMYVANLLGTDPEYQRKGLASKLLKHVLDIADREGRKAYIEATPTGRPVYLRLGFQDIDLLSVDLTRWGGTQTGINTIMLRAPKTSP